METKKFCNGVPKFIISLLEEQEDLGEGNFSEDELLWRRSVINTCQFKEIGDDLHVITPRGTLKFSKKTLGSWELLELFSHFPGSHTFPSSI